MGGLIWRLQKMLVLRQAKVQRSSSLPWSKPEEHNRVEFVDVRET